MSCCFVYGTIDGVHVPHGCNYILAIFHFLRRHGIHSNDIARQHFLTYVLSLIRGSENEHADSLPKVDVASLRHVAFVLDALIYYLRNNPAGTLSKLKIFFSFVPLPDGSSPSSIMIHHYCLSSIIIVYHHHH